VIATTTVIGYSISKNDFFYHLEADTRTAVSELVKARLLAPSQMPHLWDDAPRVLVDSEWRRRQSWQLFRNDLMRHGKENKNDIVRSFR
jgi:hypothetical protein